MCCSARHRPPVRAAEPPHSRTWGAYGPGHASVYDDLYAARGKDYDAESTTIAGEILSRAPHAVSLLDVGCGTGSHLRHLRERFPDVEGAEPAGSMRAVARERLPGVTVHDGEMLTLATGRAYDAVICMFSTIGYAGGDDGSVAGLRRAIRRMAAHLRPGGVLVIEPWMPRKRYVVGHVGADFTRTRERSIFRMSHSGLAGERVSVLTMRYLVGDRDGITQFTDVHTLTMFSRAQFRRAFAEAGCDSVDFLDPAFGRGLFIARLPGSPPGGSARNA